MMTIYLLQKKLLNIYKNNMNNVFPKFIVTINNNNQKIMLIYGKCTYHKELKPNENSIVLGGGFFYYKDNTFR